VSVIAQYEGRLANNMFQYAFARILAARMGYALRAPRLLNVANDIAGEWNVQPEQVVSDGTDIDEICANKTPRRIICHGFFQQAKHYLPHRVEMRDWFACALNPLERDAGNVVFHVRTGDYRHYGWELPQDYYRRCAAEAKTQYPDAPCKIVTDDHTSSLRYIEVIRNRWPSASIQTNFGEAVALRDFNILLGAKAIVCANSTFSWMAAFLSHAERVWMPHNWQPWGKNNRYDKHKPIDTVHPTDLRTNLPGWTTVDLEGAA
jgi:hypothetical protein